MADITQIEERYGLAGGGREPRSPRRARRRIRRRLLILRRVRYYLALTATLLAVSAMVAGSYGTDDVQGRDFAGQHWREHLRSLSDVAPPETVFGISAQAATTVTLVVIAAALWVSLAYRRR
jgi:hypothetical protein